MRLFFSDIFCLSVSLLPDNSPTHSAPAGSCYPGNGHHTPRAARHFSAGELLHRNNHCASPFFLPHKKSGHTLFRFFAQRPHALNSDPYHHAVSVAVNLPVIRTLYPGCAGRVRPGYIVITPVNRGLL